MNQVQVYKILQAQGFTKENAEDMVKALQENQELATKSDMTELKSEIKNIGSSIRSEMKDLEIRLLGAMNAQIWKFLGSIGLIAALFKLAGMIIR
jgi:hypothetical protein